MRRKGLNIALLVGIIIISSCHRYRVYETTPRTGAYEIAANKLVRGVELNNIMNEAVAINKITINYSEGGRNRKFRANMKYNGNDSILLSIRTFAGIEAARVLVEKEKITINDKINKVCYQGLTEIIGRRYGLDFELIKILFGDIGEPNIIGRKVMCVEGIAKVKEEEEGKDMEYTIDCNIKKLKAVKGTLGLNGSRIIGLFKDYQYENGVLYPATIVWEMEEEGTLINLEVNNVKRTERNNLIFRVNEDYEVRIIR
ncbi:MAG: DUF4292 domain-containing protein [Bacteroidota bacterium]